jgi:hypothetical protein
VSWEKHKKPFKKEVSRGHHFSQAKQSRGFWEIAIYLLAAIVICSAAVAIFLNFSRPGEPEVHKAALVDQLSLTFPNQSFIDNTTEILEQAGYTVDYYPGEEVTVEFYRNLPTRHYEVVILRVHSARFLLANGTLGDDVALFTGEPYDPEKYVEEGKAGSVGSAHYSNTSSSYFGITPSFVALGMEGKFEDSTVILMGCDGVRSDTMAKAFIYEGAKAFVSWTKEIQASYTDAVTESLLKHLLIEKLPLKEAMSKAIAEVGFDQIYGSELRVVSRQEED